MSAASTHVANQRRVSKRIQWSQHRPAQQYLKGRLAEYQTLQPKDKKAWLSEVQEHVLSCWTFEGAAGDVRKVRPSS